MSGIILLGDGLHDAFGELLEEDYTVRVVANPTDRADIAAAIGDLERAGHGHIAAVAIGAAATLLLESSSVLAKLYAAVLFAASPPASPVPYEQLHMHLGIHRAERGAAMSAAQLAELEQGANADNVLVFAWAYATDNDRFVIAPEDDAEVDLATIAWDRTRDFLINAVPDYSADADPHDELN